MKKKFILVYDFKKLLFSAAVLLITVIMISCSGLVKKENFNDGFENLDEREVYPEGWLANNIVDNGNNQIIKIDKKIFHSGEYSILIEIPKSFNPDNYIFKLVRIETGLDAFRTYQLTGWIKTYGINNSPYIKIEFMNKNILIGSTSTKKIQPVTGTKDWTQVNSIFKMPRNANRMLVAVSLPSFNNKGGKAWFDDLKIVPVE
jgi:hypothetical protein